MVTTFGCLFRDIQPALLRYLHVIGPDAADDVASETWLPVITGLHGFRGGEQAFRAWLFTIARHRAVDYGRARARRPTVPLAPSGAEDPLAPDAADVAINRISERAVLALISTLPPIRQRSSCSGWWQALAPTRWRASSARVPARFGWPRIAVFGDSPRWSTGRM